MGEVLRILAYLGVFGVVRSAMQGVLVVRVRAVIEPEEGEGGVARILGFRRALNLWNKEGLHGWTRGYLTHIATQALSSMGGTFGVEVAVAALEGRSDPISLVLASQAYHTSSIGLAFICMPLETQCLLSRSKSGLAGGLIDDYASQVGQMRAQWDWRAAAWIVPMSVCLNVASVAANEIQVLLMPASPALATLVYMLVSTLTISPINAVYYRLLSGKYRDRPFRDVVLGDSVSSLFGGFGLEFLSGILINAVRDVALLTLGHQ